MALFLYFASLNSTCEQIKYTLLQINFSSASKWTGRLYAAHFWVTQWNEEQHQVLTENYLLSQPLEEHGVILGGTFSQDKFKDGGGQR